MSEGELTWLAKQAQSRYMIAEIGAWCGRSTRALADHCPGVVYAIDLWAGSDDVESYGHLSHVDVTRERVIFNENIADHIASGKVIPVRMDSILPLKLNVPLFDMIFFDSAHYYDFVLTEIALWRFRLKKDGLLCGHDYGHPNLPDVKRAVDIIVGHVNTHELIWWKP